MPEDTKVMFFSESSWEVSKKGLGVTLKMDQGLDQSF